ncbi:MAG: ferritin-like metal-binding protein YciE [Flavobacteriales bacterium]|jgi:ferritin-like metal-binding protein YciE
MKTFQLMKLFEDELKNILWAEKALTKAIPFLIKNATSRDLIEVLSLHLEQTNKHVERLSEVFSHINKKPIAIKCEVMESLIKEARKIIESCESGSMRDAAIVSAVQKVEHYEIATYVTLRQFVKKLGLIEVAELLKVTLQEEKATDKKLSEVVTSAINVEVAEEEV